MRLGVENLQIQSTGTILISESFLNLHLGSYNRQINRSEGCDAGLAGWKSMSSLAADANAVFRLGRVRLVGSNRYTRLQPERSVKYCRSSGNESQSISERGSASLHVLRGCSFETRVYETLASPKQSYLCCNESTNMVMTSNPLFLMVDFCCSLSFLCSVHFSEYTLPSLLSLQSSLLAFVVKVFGYYYLTTLEI